MIVALDVAPGAEVALSVKTGSTTLWKEAFKGDAAIGTRVSLTFDPPLGCGINEAAEIAHADAGTAGQIRLKIAGYTLPN